MDSKHLALLNEVVNLFVQKDRRARLTELFSKPKRYDDGLSNLLRDPRYFDERNINQIPSSEQTIEGIYAHLKRLGFGKEYFVVSQDVPELDGQMILTAKALEAICFNSGSMLFCPISKVGYYEGHEGWRYILKPVK